MGDRLAGKRILVTGAASGIARAVARRSAAEGAQVVLVDINEAVLEVAKEVGGLGFVADVTDPAAPAQVIEQVVEKLGGLDGLANIAGGSFGDSDALSVSDEIWDRVIAVNVTGSFRWARAAIPAMLASGGGSIVNTSSIAGTHSLPHSVAYVTSKAALIGLTHSIAVDFGRRGIRCNSIAPGTIETEGLAAYNDRNPGMKEGLLALNFRNRFGTPEDVAGLFVYLLSDDADFVNGENIAIDGGRASGSVAAVAP